MLAQLQQVQHDIDAAQASLATERVARSAGGGAVVVEISGDLRVQGVTIDPEVLSAQGVDPAELEMLADMVIAATNEAIQAAQELASSRMDSATGALASIANATGLGNLPMGGLTPPRGHTP
jgi:hypothetical protein